MEGLFLNYENANSLEEFQRGNPLLRGQRPRSRSDSGQVSHLQRRLQVRSPQFRASPRQQGRAGHRAAEPLRAGAQKPGRKCFTESLGPAKCPVNASSHLTPGDFSSTWYSRHCSAWVWLLAPSIFIKIPWGRIPIVSLWDEGTEVQGGFVTFPRSECNKKWGCWDPVSLSTKRLRLHTSCPEAVRELLCSLKF